jgi:MoxR-like ATPase
VSIATQNPFEFEGTYVLPESQLDRFMMRIDVGYPNREAERNVLRSHRSGEPVDTLKPVVSLDDVRSMQSMTRSVQMEDSIVDYLQDIVDRTRSSHELQVGVSTRGALALYRASQAHALLAGRSYAVPDDVKTIAVSVLAHRVMPRGFAAGSDRTAAEAIIQRCLEAVSVPV